MSSNPDDVIRKLDKIFPYVSWCKSMHLSPYPPSAFTTLNRNFVSSFLFSFTAWLQTRHEGHGGWLRSQHGPADYFCWRNIYYIYLWNSIWKYSLPCKFETPCMGDHWLVVTVYCTGQLGQDNRDRTTMARQPWQDSRDKWNTTAETGSQDMTVRICTEFKNKCVIFVVNMWFIFYLEKITFRY
jgi:hypothetical protein